ncbi:MAG: hypothetical protein WCR20_13255 [Verrucomicrobiota bacterium]
MIDSLKFRHEEKKRIRHIKKILPDHEEIPVRINAKTTLLLKPGQDPEERKAMYLERVWRQEQREKSSKFI